MQGWEGVVLGAVIAVVSGSVTEAIRNELSRRKEKQERKESFLRETLIEILELLEKLQLAMMLLKMELKENDYIAMPSAHASDVAFTYAKLLRYSKMVPEKMRVEMKEGLDAVRPVLSARDADESDMHLPRATMRLSLTMSRLGSSLREL